jgi:hypothetical protein
LAWKGCLMRQQTTKLQTKNFTDHRITKHIQLQQLAAVTARA